MEWESDWIESHLCISKAHFWLCVGGLLGALEGIVSMVWCDSLVLFFATMR